MEVFGALFSLLGVLAPLAVAVTLVVLGLLSQRLGAVTSMPPYYRWFYVSALLVSVAAFFELLYVLSVYVDSASAFSGEGFFLLTYGAPFAVGLTISVVISWRYWGWLLSEPGE